MTIGINGVSQTSILVALGVIVTVGVFGAVMSPENTVQIIGFCSLICVSLLAMLKQIETDRKLEVVAEKAEEVKKTLVVTTDGQGAKLDNLTEVTDKTLKHVNHDRTMLLQTIAMQARQLAEGPGATDVDRNIAETAQNMYLAHVENQEKMDAANTPSTTEIKEAVKEGIEATTLDVKIVNAGVVNTDEVNVKK